MKTLKSVLGLAAIAALLSTSAMAGTVLSPRASGLKHPSVAANFKDADHVHKETAVGNAAKSKAAGHRVIAGGKNDPNLLSCNRIGKAVCSKNPCDGTMMAPCCK